MGRGADVKLFSPLFETAQKIIWYLTLTSIAFINHRRAYHFKSEAREVGELLGSEKAREMDE